MRIEKWRAYSFVPLTAADVAVPRERWVKLSPAEATPEAARAVMKSNRFDLLPIDDGVSVEEFYETRSWSDYSDIMRRRIHGADLLTPETPFREVLKGMALEGRLFYFLADRNAVLGLVSVANLNRRQVKVYLFGLICDLEVELSDLILAELPGEEIAEFLRTKDEGNPGALRKYQRAMLHGVDEHPVQSLYLSDLVNLARSEGLHRRLGYTSSAFKQTLGRIVNLRNVIAHPVTPLIDSADGVRDLWHRVIDMEDALFRLRNARP